LAGRAAPASRHGQHGQAQGQDTIHFSELAAEEQHAPGRGVGVTGDRPSWHKSGARRRGATQPPRDGAVSLTPVEAAASADLAFTAAGIPPSPPPSASFQALPDDNTRFNPDTAGAVGPNHVMTTLASQVRIHDRSGNVLSTVSLSTFWGMGNVW